MSRAAGAFSLALLLLLCASFCLTEQAEADLHWHLLAGREILRSGSVPQADPFSYASAGRPWIDLHWLFQVLVAGVHRGLGWDGLDLLKIFLMTAAFAVATAVAVRRGASTPAAALVLLPALVASQERFTLRPEAASFLLLAVLQGLLAERRRRPPVLVAVPVLLALWANLHALFAVGLALVLLTLAGDLIDRLRRAPAAGDAGAPAGPAPLPGPAFLGGVAAAGVLATLLTPYGAAGWTLPRRLLLERIGGGTIYARHIAEFQAPFGGYAVTASIAAFAVLAALIGWAAWAHRRGATAADLLALTSFFGIALLARRNLPLFALVAIPAGAPMVEAAARRLATRRGVGPIAVLGRRLGPATAACTVALIAVWLLSEVWSNRFYERDGTQRYFGRGLAAGHYPEGAADFVLGQPLPGEAIHDLAAGGFLAWRWYPERRVFLDGRLEVHGEDLFATYLRMQSDPVEFEAAARRYGAGVVVASYRPEWGPLLRHLADGGAWRPVYVDHAAAVFVRAAGGASDPAPPAVDLADPDLGRRILEEVRRAHERSAHLDPAPRWLRRLLPRRPVPVAETNAALFFGLTGRHANSELLFREAIDRAPRNAVLRYDLGIVLDGAGRAAEAAAAYREALRLDPGLVPAREALALYRLRHGDPDGALREWEAAERAGSLGPASLLARGALLDARGRLDDAIEDYRKAVAADPQRADLRGDLAVLYQKRGLRQQAQEMLDRARDLDPRGCVADAARGRVLAAARQPDQAEVVLRDLARRVPGCAEAHVALAALLAAAGRREEAAGAAAAALEAGADPGALSSDPVLRMLVGVASGAAPATGAPGRPDR
jgi:tetratricopeptide (TPR) repeat protein